LHELIFSFINVKSNGYLRLRIVHLLLSIVSAFKHILLNVFFPCYFMHSSYRMIKANT